MIKSRAYQASDKAAVLEIFISNIGQYFAQEETQDFIAFLDSQTKDNQYLVFYSEDNPEILLACGGYGVLEHKVFLRWGMVAQKAHQQGVGRRLLLDRLRAVRDAFGEVEVYIDTSQHVQGFYEKFGFQAISSIKDGFAPNIDKVRMLFEKWHKDFVKPSVDC